MLTRSRHCSGKFDRPVEGETSARQSGKRRKFLPVTGGSGGAQNAERASMAAALSQLGRRDAGEGKLNVDRAINLAAAESAKRGRQAQHRKRK